MTSTRSRFGGSVDTANESTASEGAPGRGNLRSPVQRRAAPGATAASEPAASAPAASAPAARDQPAADPFWFATGGTNAIPDPLRGRLESSYQTDLSGVQLVESSREASALGADGFARGDEIHVAGGATDHLIAHEAAHVVQQREGRVEAAAQFRGVAINQDESLEREADHMADTALAGGAARTTPTTATAPASSTAQGYFSIDGKRVDASAPQVAQAADGAGPQRAAFDDAATDDTDHGEPMAWLGSQASSSSTAGTAENSASAEGGVGLLEESDRAGLLANLEARSGPSNSNADSSSGPASGEQPPEHDCEPWEVFQIRVANWNASYGRTKTGEVDKQRLYGDACLDAVRQVVEQVEGRTLRPDAALGVLAKARHVIAQELGHENAGEFGKERAETRSNGQSMTPITGRYAEYGVKTHERFAGREGVVAEDAGSKITADQFGMTGVKVSGKIGHEEVPLTETMFDNDFPAKSPQHEALLSDYESRLAAYHARVKAKEADPEAAMPGPKPKDHSGQPPGSWGHTTPTNARKVIAMANDLYAEAMLGAMTFPQIKRRVAELHWWLAHAMPYKRGSAAIVDMLTKTIWMHHRVKVHRWKAGVVPDLEAFMRPLEDFVAAYDSFFEAAPVPTV